MSAVTISCKPNAPLHWPAAHPTRAGRSASGDVSSVPGFFLAHGGKA
jgi:hypothetical protein